MCSCARVIGGGGWFCGEWWWEKSIVVLCSGVKVSTLSQFIRKAEKSTGPAKSCSIHDLELVVSFVEKTIQDAEKVLQLVDHQHLFQTLDVRALPSHGQSALALLL
nr:hypothetical protein [Tanacetum cinerariifolium]